MLHASHITTIKTLALICFILSCTSHQEEKRSVKKEIHIPDSTNSFYASLQYEEYKRLKTISRQLNLDSLEIDTNNLDIRIWSLHSSYNPQNVIILKEADSKYLISSIKFYLKISNWDIGKIDSAIKNRTTEIALSDLQNLKLDSIWQLPSQSEMKNGDSFGCVDGNNVLIEMSNKERYKYAFYKCPYILRDRDKVFETINLFNNKIASLLH